MKPVLIQYLLLVLCLHGAGCRGELSPGQEFSGKVTVEGEPLRIGTLTLKPLGKEFGPKISIRIQNGKFHVPAEHGPWPGDFQVMIASIPPDLEAMLAGASHEEMLQKAREPSRVISKEFDANSKIQITIKQGEENRGEFDVKWAPKRS